MNIFDRRTLVKAVALLPLVAPVVATSVLAQQQALPGDAALEILVKQTLLTFNDANLTGNYSVFHSSLSDQFRRQFTVEQVRQAFVAFNQQQIDLAGIILHKYVLNQPARLDQNGSLEVAGRFDTRPLNVIFSLTYVPIGNNEWKLLALSVNATPPGSAPPASPDKAAKGKM